MQSSFASRFHGLSGLSLVTLLALVASPASAGETAQAATTSAASPAQAAQGREPRAILAAPMFSEEFASFPIAIVGGEPIPLRELVDALAASHDRRSNKASAGEFLPMLERIIDVRLMLLEAREAGIHELPEVTKAIEEYTAASLIKVLEAEVSKDVEPDPEEVEKLLRARVREWKIRSLLFKGEAGEADAAALVAAVARGEPFDGAAKLAIADKKASGSETGEFIPEAKLLREVRDVVRKLEVGGVGGPVKMKGGVAVVHLEDVRYPDDAKQRAEVEELDRARRQSDTVWAFYAELQKKHLKKIDWKLFDAVDFHARKPGFKALTKDKRALVTFKDSTEKTITVGDLADGVAAVFFHGMDSAIKEKRVNTHKRKALDELLVKRLFTKEAKSRKIAESVAYRTRMKEFENSLVFGKFVEKAVVPNVRVEEAELKAYYDEHGKDEFATPELYTLDGIGFRDVAKAQTALQKLQSGTDFKWLKVNGDGVLPQSEQDRDLMERTVTRSSMPAALSSALVGAREGDYRLYASPAGPAYVVRVMGHVAASVRPLDEVKKTIHDKLFAENVQKTVRDWAAKVRQSYDVEIFITRIDH
jgi:parvulin-like peptidyl-prolyl isomerase